jgi:hypothetical protein
MNERYDTPFGAWPYIIKCIQNSTRNENHQPDMFVGFVLELISSTNMVCVDCLTCTAAPHQS